MVGDRDADAAGRDIGLKFSTVKSARWTPSRWPADRRQPGVSFTVQRTLAFIEDEEERSAIILTPPEGKPGGSRTTPAARVANHVETPVTPQEKITAVHSLARTTRSPRR